MQLSRADAIEADIFCWEDGKPWRGPTWPTEDGLAIMLCRDCGEIDEAGEHFKPGTVYSNMGEKGDNEPGGRHRGCNVCKSHGYLYIGI